MHIQDGVLKAYLDEQLDEGQRAAVAGHISTCVICERRSQELAQRSAYAAGKLSMSVGLTAGRARKRDARAQIEARLSHKETSMLRRIFSRPYRPAWAAALVILLLAAALALPPLQAIANDFLGLFRVKQFTVVQVNPAGLPEQLGRSGTLESIFTNNLQFETSGEPQAAAGRSEASAAAGIDVRLPLRAGGEPQIMVNPGGKITFNVDLELARAVLQEIGRSDLELPDNLNGAVIQVDVPVSVSAQYGGCQPDPQAALQKGYDPDGPRAPFASDCTTLIQMPSPVVTAPPNLDIDRLAQVFLQVLGMSEQDAAHFSASVDWTTTLVLPVPTYGTSYQDVIVDGVSGTIIQQELENHSSQYLLLWVKDDIVYALTGPGSEVTALQIAGSME